MKLLKRTSVNRGEPEGFDLFRLSKSKEVVDLCSNTLRAYHRMGLPFYRCGKAVFVSKVELTCFIRTKAQTEGPVS